MRIAAVLLPFLLAGAALAEEPAPVDADAPVAATTPAPGVDDLLQRVLAVQRGITSISGRFTQRSVRIDDPEQGSDVYVARFALMAPDKYNIVYTKPGDDEYRKRFCSDGQTRAEQEQILADQAPDTVVRPVVKGDDDAMRRITALFRLDAAALTRDFTITPRARGDAYTVLLVPRAPGLAEHIQRVEVDLDPSLRTTGMRIDDPRGNRILIAIEEVAYNPTLPPETFTVPAP